MKWSSRCCAVFATAMVSLLIEAKGEEIVQADMKREVTALRLTVESLRSEVATLREALVRIELRAHQDTIRRLKAEIAGLHAENARLTEMDRARRQDLRDVEDLLTRSELHGDARRDAEAIRSELELERGREIAEQLEAVRNGEKERLRHLETEEYECKRLEEASQKGTTK
jgi:hypothetical protein